MFSLTERENIRYPGEEEKVDVHNTPEPRGTTGPKIIRKEFASGMVRDVEAGKVDYTRVLDGPMLDRWAELLTKSTERYPDVEAGVPNWTLANGQEELVRFRKSAFRHFRQWLRGDTDEDHAAAVWFNMNGYEYVKERMKREQQTKAA
jgi:phytoene dehydrogenase-like protein